MAETGNSAISQRPVWGVAALLQAASDALWSRLGPVALRGELSGFSRATSGHCYFSLKDEGGAPALLRCAMFRRAAMLIDFTPTDGQRVELRGRLDLYAARGELQLVVEAMVRVGQGTLYEEFLRLRARLEALGMFDPARKRPLPAYPRRLGVITSPGAAALHDVLTALARRAPHVEVLIYPCLVQGAEAPASLVGALALASERREVDALLLVRGGGSLEDLWAFNDERVVRAVAASALPVVCGVGHETDITLADLAADLRAPTPTAAAELAAPAQAQLMLALDQLSARALRALRRHLDSRVQGLDLLAGRLAHGASGARVQRQRLELIEHTMRSTLVQRLKWARHALVQTSERWVRAQALGATQRRDRLRALGERLALLDPQHVLSRGYALVQTPAGDVVRSPRQLNAGEPLTLSLAEGRVELVPGQVRPL